MNEQEQIRLLKLQLAESEKRRINAEKKFDKEKTRTSDLLDKVDAYKNEVKELKAELKMISDSLKSLNENHRIALFLKFGSQSEKYRRVFNIPPSFVFEKSASDLTAAEKNMLHEAEAAAKKIMDEDDKDSENDFRKMENAKRNHNTKNKRDRNPEKRKRGTSNGKQIFDEDYPREDEELFFYKGECPDCHTPLIRINTIKGHEYVEMFNEALKIVKTMSYGYYCPKCGVSTDSKTKKETKRIIYPSSKTRFIPGGLAGNNLIAYSLCLKYCYGLSSSRLHKLFMNYGIDISEQNFSNWFIKAGLELEPLAEEIKKEILKENSINADETRYMVLDEADRLDTTKSWLWVICNASNIRPKAYFRYDSSRSSNVFKDIVGDYSGYLQADCCGGYQTQHQNYQYTLSLCLAHLRRRFVDAFKKGNYIPASPGYVTLNSIISIIGKIYEADTVNRNKYSSNKITKEEFLKIRKIESEPLFDKLTKVAIGRKALHERDQSIMEGINYYLNHKDLFSVYLDCAELGPDNSKAERVIKAFSRIRTNTLFAGSPQGAKAMATLETVVVTAVSNNVDVVKYMNYLLDSVSLFRHVETTDSDYQSLLPWNLSESKKKEISINLVSDFKKI
jgi:transposase